jgi:hypothetical protein
MLWKTSRPLHIPLAAQPVPDAHALRRAALQTSWRRDRWVARRRLALRWMLWALERYGTKIVGGFALVAAAWIWLLPLVMPEPEPKPTVSAAELDKAFVVPPLNFDTALHSQEP